MVLHPSPAPRRNFNVNLKQELHRPRWYSVRCSPNFEVSPNLSNIFFFVQKKKNITPTSKSIFVLAQHQPIECLCLFSIVLAPLHQFSHSTVHMRRRQELIIKPHAIFISPPFVPIRVVFRVGNGCPLQLLPYESMIPSCHIFGGGRGAGRTWLLTLTCLYIDLLVRRVGPYSHHPS